MVCGNVLAFRQWKSENGRAELPNRTDNERARAERGKRGDQRLLSSILSGVFLLAYPLVVLSYFRAHTTSDWARFAIVCGVHPIAQELLVTGNRLTQRQRVIPMGAKNLHYALVVMGTPSVMEE